jgi:3-hydroxybutyryl-CoA dehydratase
MIEEGAAVERLVTFTDDMLSAFSALTNDSAPVHFDRATAVGMGFKDRIVHGFLVSSIYSEMLGCRLPGPGSVIQKVSVDLVAPVYVGDTLSFRVAVTRFTEAVMAVSLSLSATNDQGAVVNRGSAVCILRR